MPTSPIAAASNSATQPGVDTGVGYVLHNWSTNYKNITVGPNDISFVADPFPSSTPAPAPTAVSSNNSTINANSQVMQINYPKGSYSPKAGPVAGGTSFYAKPFGDETPFDKMMISYDVAFPNGFDWVLGGKLPGIYGGSPHSCSGGNQSTGNNCLTMRLMWRQDGGGEVYAYIPVSDNSDFCKNPNVQCNDQFGKSIGRGVLYFPPGAWTRIDMVMQLNDPAGYNNGVLDVYINGLKYISMNTIPYRSTGMVGFQGLMFSTFFGGNTPNYATPVDTSVFFRNVQLSVGEPARLYEGNGGTAAGGKIVGSRADIATQQALIKEIFQLISKRPDTVCNFLEGSQMLGGQDTRVIYRHYATLYFVFVVDESESELGILDLIQVFVESLDRCFENVCELDLIFHFKEVHDILAEVITGGMVLETDIGDIVAAVQETGRLAKKPTGLLAQKSPF
ncbi:hypothetical protein BGZ96_007433 [Linnemannia gamsii]|uniref:AP complex mu/sigma subunit domain-containing protein n=1 Tax=Linnemannia gamsii TaxID=64522 RepID=A0ABQ7K1V6_9FUNG|nr:hypothetical protein BGZ96_007433 [Linnemannia gamsii]